MSETEGTTPAPTGATPTINELAEAAQLLGVPPEVLLERLWGDGSGLLRRPVVPPAPDQQPRRRRSREKVEHLYLIGKARRFAALGIDGYPLLCGRWSPGGYVAGQEIGVEVPTVGGLMAVADKRDCRVCVRALESVLARRAAGQRGRGLGPAASEQVRLWLEGRQA